MELIQNTHLNPFQDANGKFKSGVISAWAGHNWGICRKCGKFHKVHADTWIKGKTANTDEKVRKMGIKLSNIITNLWQDPIYRQKQLEARQKSEKFQNSDGRFKEGQIPHNKGKISPWVIEMNKQRKNNLSKENKNFNYKFIISVTAECDFCGKEVVRQKSEFERRFHIFCNQNCTLEWRKTDNFKKAQSERTGKSQKIVWQNDNYKKRMKEIRIEKWKDPVYKEQMKQSGLNAWKENEDRRKNLSQKLSGENHHNWQGGKSLEEYGKEFDSGLKEQIRLRDGYKCKLCGCSQVENGRQLNIHHSDENKKNNRTDNLIALCNKCHIKIHKKNKRKEGDVKGGSHFNNVGFAFVTGSS